MFNSNPDQIAVLKKSIIDIGRLLWSKDLASGCNGNISARIDEEVILMTAHGTCLGMLREEDILLIKIEDGSVLGKGKVSTEILLHTEIYKQFPKIKRVVHTHTTYVNAYFLRNESFVPEVYEAKMTLGEVKAIEQLTPAVTDVKPVIEVLKNSSLAVLKKHGVVSVGDNHFDCFSLIQVLEESIKVDAISRLYLQNGSQDVDAGPDKGSSKVSSSGKKYELFSEEQMNEIVRLVNEDNKMKELGTQTSMNMDLAVKLDETGDVFCFKFRNGTIETVCHEEDVEFVINAPENIWRAVFNQELDPFVATTQKKMHLQGDFAKISKWYAPCSRVFELWGQVPV